MREMSVAEQRYTAALPSSGPGRTISEVAASWRVSKQTLQTWLRRYEDGGLEALGNRSHRPSPARARLIWTSGRRPRGAAVASRRVRCG
ncbi:helix-turn-helix domain-containing protein [Cellulomonas endophytica]|uniref:helix-turn-helix domain-containing protein n=1 Tax=Cellulomonas endophytica TaxID=2494735 RepID=UPI00101259D1